MTMSLSRSLDRSLERVAQIGCSFTKPTDTRSQRWKARNIAKLPGLLPSTLTADESSGGLGTKITFERVIVMPDGQRWVGGVTPKQLPKPSSHELPNSTSADSN
jgi:hypothetical protein